MAQEQSIPSIKKSDLIITGHDLKKNLPKIDWLWKDYIPKGLVTILAGDPGVGKSAIALDLVKRLTDGTEWPDGTPILSNSKALWIDAEGAKVILNERIEKMRINLDHIILPKQKDLLQDFTMTKENFKQVHAILKEYKPDLIVVDSLSGIHLKEENDSKEMKIVMNWFNSWASKHNVAVLVIHHLSKPSKGDFSGKVLLNRLRGSGQIGASVRSALAIENITVPFYDTGPEVKFDLRPQLVQIKNNLGKEKKVPLPFSIDDEGVTYYGSCPDDFYPQPKFSQEEKAKNLIVKILKENGGEISAEDIKKQLKDLGLSESTWKRAKDKLPVESIKKGEKWLWRLNT